MKRNMDLVRDLPLGIEACPAGEIFQQDKDFKNYNEHDVFEHLKLLEQADYITNKGGFNIFDLTLAGNDFLNSIKENKTWETIKEKIFDNGISFTICAMIWVLLR